MMKLVVELSGIKLNALAISYDALSWADSCNSLWATIATYGSKKPCSLLKCAYKDGPPALVWRKSFTLDLTPAENCVPLRL